MRVQAWTLLLFGCSINLENDSEVKKYYHTLKANVKKLYRNLFRHGLNFYLTGIDPQFLKHLKLNLDAPGAQSLSLRISEHITALSRYNSRHSAVSSSPCEEQGRVVRIRSGQRFVL